MDDAWPSSGRPGSQATVAKSPQVASLRAEAIKLAAGSGAGALPSRPGRGRELPMAKGTSVAEADGDMQALLIQHQLRSVGVAVLLL